MQPVEAMTILLDETSQKMALTHKMSELSEMTAEQKEWCENVELAVSVGYAMLNTALPVVKFRVFIQVTKQLATRRGPPQIEVNEFTLCATSIKSIRDSLLDLETRKKTDVYINLWEQRADGATMHSGFQGNPRSKQFLLWVNSLDQFDPTVQ